MIVSVITVQEMDHDDLTSTRIIIGCEDMAEDFAARLRTLDFSFTLRHGEERPSRGSREQFRAAKLMQQVMAAV